MPFFKTKPAPTRNLKLEKQQYLAKFGPSNVVNYADCCLDSIPTETYSLCNLFLKEVLILHSNRLKDLREDGVFTGLSKLENLRVLDLHNNLISSLPAELSCLTNLQVLNLENNKLKALCPEICRLKFLQTLNVKSNFIMELPSSLGDLISLRTLDISKNQLTRLPTSLCFVRCLEVIVLDAANMTYPPAEICSSGATSILQFLCSDNKVEFISPSENVVNLLNNPRDSSNASTAFSSMPGLGAGRLSPMPGMSHSCENIQNIDSAIDHYENIKELKRLEMAKLQRDLFENFEKEALLIAEANMQKSKLLCHLEKENQNIADRLDQISRQQEETRHRTLQDLQQSEQSTKLLIENLLHEHEEVDRLELMKSSEAFRLNEENALRIKLNEYDNLRKAEIEKAMELQMRELCTLDNLQRLNDEKRKIILERVVKLEINDHENLEILLKSKQKHLDRVISTISKDEELQKKALLILMQGKDERTNRINEQLRLIQEELVRLTLTEMKNRDMRDVNIQKQLEYQRNDLKRMMEILVQEREARNLAIRNRLVEMEKQRQEEQADYWLVQYQRLLDMKPTTVLYIEKSLDDDVKKLLIEARATIYLPLFAKKMVTLQYLLDHPDESSLQALGIHDTALLENLLKILRNRIERRKLEQKVAVSETNLPAVQAHFEVECVICIERKSSIVFMPCGHVCCCVVCEMACSTCPMCRSKIDRKINLSIAPLSI